MNGRYLLDTNIVIALFRSEAVVVEHLGSASEVFLSSTVVGELYYGAYKSGRVAANVERLEEFVREMEVLCPDAVTAKFYGQMKQGLNPDFSPGRIESIRLARNEMSSLLTRAIEDA